MNSIGITGTEQIFLGLYIIAHGLIHLIFLFHFKDEKTNSYTGWSRTSWLLHKILNENYMKLIGFSFWIAIATGFTIIGLEILDLISLNIFFIPTTIFVSVIAILAYFIFIDGLKPTAWHWILGVLINLSIMVFLGFSNNNINLLIIILSIIWVYGLLFHSKVMKFAFKENYPV